LNTGKIVQVSGPVVDVLFETGALPKIKEALEVQDTPQRCVMEVAQHMGERVVRCIMLSPSEGLCRDMEVTATGSSICVPVGAPALGRLFNVLGDPIDGKGPVETQERWSIHRTPPSFEGYCFIPKLRAASSRSRPALLPVAHANAVEPGIILSLRLQYHFGFIPRLNKHINLIP
jgi:F-type H+-transporting ATPase subunit beta